MINVPTTPKEDQLCINTIRFLSVDAIQKANSGHPGLPMGSAPMAYVLWTKFLKYSPTNPHWFDRDRFILSAGHGSMLLYSLLYLTGYDLSLEDIKNFRQFGSKAPGHPEFGETPGVEVTTGPLGQGFANGVGMAIAEANLASRFNKPDHSIVDHYTYALVSDGDLMEGIASEAASLAGQLKLGKLIYLYDSNHITLSASTQLNFTENVQARFAAYDWHTLTVEDGNDLDAITEAIKEAQQETDRPSLITVHTHIGYGSPNKQDTYKAHGSPLGEEEVKLTKENLGWPTEPDFYVPEEVLKIFRSAVGKGKDLENQWDLLFSQYSEANQEQAALLKNMIEGNLPSDWTADIPVFEADAKGIATRSASGKILNAVAPKIPQLIGGAADLNPSTLTAMKDLGDFQAPEKASGAIAGAVGGVWGYQGRNITFGVREHAMAGISNGITAHGGLLSFCSTFLIFSDYMRPAIRLSALSKLHTIYVFTHDSIGVGEDGPTHQPIEQLASFRAMPNMITIRPCDANETVEAWKFALESSDRPVALILTRQNLPTLDRSVYAPAESLLKGAYILSEASGSEPDMLLIASGSEVSLVLGAQKKLQEKGIAARVVSMPSWELFEAQPEEYKQQVLPKSVTARVAVEAASPMGWYKYAGSGGLVIGMETFGASAPGSELMKHFGFTVDNICEKAQQLLQH